MSKALNPTQSDFSILFAHPANSRSAIVLGSRNRVASRTSRQNPNPGRGGADQHRRAILTQI